MNKGKKVLLAVVLIPLLLYLLYFFGTGLNKRSDMVSATDHIAETDGTISFRAAPMSSIGYARACRADFSGPGAYLTFYSAFGGLNGSIGATYDFTISVPDSCSQIYFPRGDGSFQLILEQDPNTGLWINCIRDNIRVPAP